jgi:hypothetical protein
VDDGDIVLRNATYRLFVELGRAPTAEEVADATARTGDDVREGWQRLHEAHALVLEHGIAEIRMLNPFSAVPTAHRVRVAGRSWYANCAWDALGICAALGADGHITTSCPDCREEIELDVVDQQPSDQSLLFHSFVPAAHWWDDIVFT